MSLQSNKCFRFFRKYILYNTEIIFGPKNKEITYLHLLLFHEVNQTVFIKLLFSFGFHPESCGSGHGVSNEYWHCQQQESHPSCDCPALLLPLQLQGLGPPCTAKPQGPFS